MPDISDTFCIMPFKEIYSSTKGRYRLCCHAETSQIKVEDHTPFDYFSSDHMKDTRLKFLSNEKPKECNVCWKMEERKSKSWRQIYNERAGTKYKDIKISLKLQGIGTNFCNLACYMCHPTNSNTKTNEIKDIFTYDEIDKVWGNEEATKVNFKRYNEIVENILKNIHHVDIIRLLGGEPLQLPKHWELLERIPDNAAKNIMISYDTNLTNLTWKNYNLDWVKKKFKEVWLGISCDHFGEKLKYIRYPIDVEKFEKNLKKIKDDNYKHRMHVTVGILNIQDLHEIKKYYNDKGMTVGFNNIVSSPKIFSICNLPQKMKNYYLKKYHDETPIVSELLKPAHKDNGYKEAFTYLDVLFKHRKLQWREVWSDLIKEIKSYE
tara:strand:- start:664 stop:1797 length:1134 start_codon:yes stop_codon:yes gene_type:complete